MRIDDLKDGWNLSVPATKPDSKAQEPHLLLFCAKNQVRMPAEVKERLGFLARRSKIFW
jgi:hypothetical protein